MSQDAELHNDGFAIVEPLLDQKSVDRIRHDVAALAIGEAVKTRQGRIFGARNLLSRLPSLVDILKSTPLENLVRRLMGKQAKPVRCLFFDKNVSANWSVAWHQDLTIAVRGKRPVAGFGSWTVKAGIPHVQPPVSILEKMLTLRLHLDMTDESNGALRVIPGSHRLGRLSPLFIEQLTRTKPARACTVQTGGALFIKPLLLHSSLSSRAPSHRRVVAVEFSADDLPGGLEWFG